jgi:hypothetical protein
MLKSHLEIIRAGVVKWGTVRTEDPELLGATWGFVRPGPKIVEASV